jgi:PncC family amidohydrolase
MNQTFVENIIKKLIDKKLHVAFAESCTAGLAADAIVQISGASQVFWGSFVTYSNDAKIKMLGIDPQLIEKYGAVSEECALAMADGARNKSGADLAISVTGLAGPESDESGLPVGTVWIGWAGKNLHSGATCCLFSGTRSEIRESAAETVIKKLSEIIH